MWPRRMDINKEIICKFAGRRTPRLLDIRYDYGRRGLAVPDRVEMEASHCSRSCFEE